MSNNVTSEISLHLVQSLHVRLYKVKFWPDTDSQDTVQLMHKLWSLDSNTKSQCCQGHRTLVILMFSWNITDVKILVATFEDGELVMLLLCYCKWELQFYLSLQGYCIISSKISKSVGHYQHNSGEEDVRVRPDTGLMNNILWARAMFLVCSTSFDMSFIHGAVLLHSIIETLFVFLGSRGPPAH